VADRSVLENREDLKVTVAAQAPSGIVPADRVEQLDGGRRVERRNATMTTRSFTFDADEHKDFSRTTGVAAAAGGGNCSFGGLPATRVTLKSRLDAFEQQLEKAQKHHQEETKIALAEQELRLAQENERELRLLFQHYRSVLKEEEEKALKALKDQKKKFEFKEGERAKAARSLHQKELAQLQKQQKELEAAKIRGQRRMESAMK
jgi:hypothetical protein